MHKRKKENSPGGHTKFNLSSSSLNPNFRLSSPAVQSLLYPLSSQSSIAWLQPWPALSSRHTQYLAVLLYTFWVPHNMKSIFVNLKRYLPEVTHVILYIFQVNKWDLYNFKSLEMDPLLEASSAPRQAFFFLCLSRMTRTLVVLQIYQK